jgi:hypothetical protein
MTHIALDGHVLQIINARTKVTMPSINNLSLLKTPFVPRIRSADGRKRAAVERQKCRGASSCADPSGSRLVARVARAEGQRRPIMSQKSARRWVNYFATPLPQGADRLPDEDDLTEMMAVVIGHQ